jgi:hypothetical protein
MLNSEQIATIVKRDGAVGAVHTVYQLLGLENPETGARYWDQELDQPVLESDAPWKPSMLSVKELAKGFLGCDGESLDRALGQSCRAHRETGDVMEAGADIVPSQFANISAFNAATAGLLEARMLEMYTRPMFVLTNVVETIPSNKRQEKLIGIGMVGDTAEERKPGNPHHRINVSERYVTSPITINRGNGVDVTREAVMFDLTRELLTQAETASETLGLRKEYLITDCVIGVTNTYTYDGTTYNTYLTSGNWINKITGNALSDWTNFNAANQLFAQMTDQETGQPIEIDVKQVLVMPYKEMSSRYVFNFTGLENTSSDLTRRGFAPNPLGGGRYEFLPPSKYAYKRATDATGLNLSATNAQVYWWLGDFTKAFAWVQNLPLTIVRATATDYQMADRGLMFSLFADEMGTAMVKDPRYVVLSTN